MVELMDEAERGRRHEARALEPTNIVLLMPKSDENLALKQGVG